MCRVTFSQFSHSVLYDYLRPINCSMPGLPVHHKLPESTQTHVHWVGDVIQPSHPLSSPSPPALNLSHLQGLFKQVSSSHQESAYINLNPVYTNYFCDLWQNTTSLWTSDFSITKWKWKLLKNWYEDQIQ